MSKTKQAEKKSKKANKKDAAQTDAQTLPAQGDAVDLAQNAGATETVTTKQPRQKKNATASDLDHANIASAGIWLSEFYEQGEKHEPRKGYDQHWNSEGFIHAGPADRLPNKGAAKMGVFLVDMLAKRELKGDANGVEAGAFLDFLIEFAQNRRQALTEAQNDEILRKAAEITAAKAGTPAAGA